MGILNKLEGKLLARRYGVVVLEDVVYCDKKHKEEIHNIAEHYKNASEEETEGLAYELFFLARYVVNKGKIIKKIKPVKPPKYLAGDKMPEYYRSVHIKRNTGDFNGVSVMEGHMVWTEQGEKNVWVGDVGSTKDYVFEIQGDDVWEYIK